MAGRKVAEVVKLLQGEKLDVAARELVVAYFTLAKYIVETSRADLGMLRVVKGEEETVKGDPVI
jgi:hypothetical protein